MDKSIAIYDAVSKARNTDTLFGFAASVNCDRGHFYTINHSCCKHRDAKHSCFVRVCLHVVYRTWEHFSTLWNSTTGKWPDLLRLCNLCSRQTNSRIRVPEFQIKTGDFGLISFSQKHRAQWCNGIFSSAAFQTVIEVAAQLGTSRALWSAWKDLRYCTI